LDPYSDLEECEEGGEQLISSSNQEGNDDHPNSDSEQNHEEDPGEAPSLTTSNRRKFVSHLQYLRHTLARRNKSKAGYFLNMFIIVYGIEQKYVVIKYVFQYGYHRIWSATRLSQHYVIDSMLRIKAQRDWHTKQNYTHTLSSQK
jgi:hypothetical protein